MSYFFLNPNREASQQKEQNNNNKQEKQVLAPANGRSGYTKHQDQDKSLQSAQNFQIHYIAKIRIKRIL